MSTWKDVPSLRDYVYRSDHVEFMRRRREWFERMKEMHQVLWWVPRGHRPTVGEAIARLDTLRAKGPTAEAFTFAKAFASPDAAQADAPFALADECPA
jgi:hypothetical protein